MLCRCKICVVLILTLSPLVVVSESSATLGAGCGSCSVVGLHKIFCLIGLRSSNSEASDHNSLAGLAGLSVYRRLPELTSDGKREV